MSTETRSALMAIGAISLIVAALITALFNQPWVALGCMTVSYGLSFFLLLGEDTL